MFIYIKVSFKQMFFFGEQSAVNRLNFFNDLAVKDVYYELLLDND